MDTITIKQLTPDDLGRAIGTLRQAFRDDPIFCFHFPDVNLRLRVLEIFFSDVVRSHMALNHVYAALDGEKLIGVAVWRPPNVTVAGLPTRLRGLLTRYRLLALAPRTARKLLRGFAALEAMHPIVPHWYLFFIAVESEQRGRGIGARLMAPVLQAADIAGVPCYLETPFAQTVPFYRLLGYDITSEPRPFAGAPRLWAMSRKPRLQR